MSETRPTVNQTPFQPPERFILAFLEGKVGKTKYPTILMSYVNSDVGWPDPQELAQVQAIAIHFEPRQNADAVLEIVCFYSPEDDLMDFTHSRYYKTEIDTEPTDRFLKRVEELNRVVFMVNAEHYTYRALVDDETGEVLESQIEYRFLN